MKFKCNKEKLSEALFKVQIAITAKSSIPVLEGILIHAEKDKIYLSACNLDFKITTSVDADIEKQGSIVLQGRLFTEMIRKMPSETISFSCDDRLIATIKGGKTEFTILGMPADEFPEMEEDSSKDNILISSQVLKSMIRQTIYAVAVSDAKPVHKGVLFDIEDNILKLVAVDGHRLALRKEAINTDYNVSFIISGKTLSEISKLLSDEDDEVKLIISKRNVVFEIENCRIVSKLIEGEFLDYKKTIPTESKSNVRVVTRMFVDSVERCSLLINDRLKSPIKCEFDPDNNEIEVSSSTTIGKSTDYLPAAISGETVEIGFNNKYLLDALRNTEADEIKIELNGPLSPIKILPVENDNFVFLVLPVRLK